MFRAVEKQLPTASQVASADTLTVEREQRVHHPQTLPDEGNDLRIAIGAKSDLNKGAVRLDDRPVAFEGVLESQFNQGKGVCGARALSSRRLRGGVRIESRRFRNGIERPDPDGAEIQGATGAGRKPADTVEAAVVGDPGGNDEECRSEEADDVVRDRVIDFSSRFALSHR